MRIRKFRKNEGVTIKDYDARYFELQAKGFQVMKEWAKQRIAHVLPSLGPSLGEVIADIGCGTGTFVVECTKRGSTVIGIDFSRFGLQMTKLALNSNFAMLLCSAAENLAIKDETFDKVVCADLVEHLFFHQFTDLIRELRRTIKPNGLLVIYTPSPSLVSVLPNFIKRLGRLLFRLEEPTGHEFFEYVEKRYGADIKSIERLYHVDIKSARSIIGVLKSRGFRIEREVHMQSGMDVLEKIPVIQRYIGGHTLVVARKAVE